MEYVYKNKLCWPKIENYDHHVDYYFNHTQSLRYLIDHCIKQDTAIQAGGGYGLWPLILSKTFKYVYTFEPEPICFFYLSKNCIKKDNIIFKQAALGEKNNKVTIKRKSFLSHKIIRNDLTNEEGKVDCITIDSLKLKKCDAIILDIEGYEYFALQGAIETIKKFKPLILIEEDNIKKMVNYNYKHDKNRLIDKLLKKFGYKKEIKLGHDWIYRVKK